MTRRIDSLLLALAICATARFVMAGDAYVQTKDVVFAEVDGVGLLMDVFVPTGQKNALAIVDVASGSYYSDRGKIKDHQKAQVYDIFCGRGYTMFVPRPGSTPRFNVAEMARHVKKCIVWVKEHAADYQIDPNRLGLTGASAGGHIASLVAVTADEATAVKAAGVFFPPTDLLEFRGTKIDADSPPAQLAFAKRFAFPNGAGPASASELVEKLKQVSPAHCVTDKAPPFLLIHGDADPLVPLSQSERLLAALKEAGVPAELIVKKGGGHPWPTIHEEVRVLADWFDKQLADK